MKDEQTVTMTVTREEALMIFDLLMDQPYRKVALLVQRLMTEVNTSLAPPAPPAVTEPAVAGLAALMPSPSVIKAYGEAFPS